MYHLYVTYQAITGNYHGNFHESFKDDKIGKELLKERIKVLLQTRWITHIDICQGDDMRWENLFKAGEITAPQALHFLDDSQGWKDTTRYINEEVKQKKKWKKKEKKQWQRYGNWNNWQNENPIIKSKGGGEFNDLGLKEEDFVDRDTDEFNFDQFRDMGGQ